MTALARRLLHPPLVLGDVSHPEEAAVCGESKESTE